MLGSQHLLAKQDKHTMLANPKLKSTALLKSTQEDMLSAKLEYNLSTKHVYEINSQYQLLFKTFQIAEGASGHSKGISLSFFVSNCNFIKEMDLDVALRVIVASGADYESRNSFIDWTIYVDTYALLELDDIKPDKIIRFWMKFLDPKCIGVVNKSVYYPLFEKMIKGRSLQPKSIASDIFAENLYKCLLFQNCLNLDESLDMTRFKHALETQAIDVTVLCSALRWKRKLDAQALDSSLY